MHLFGYTWKYVCDARNHERQIYTRLLELNYISSNNMPFVGIHYSQTVLHRQYRSATSEDTAYKGKKGDKSIHKNSILIVSSLGYHKGIVAFNIHIGCSNYVLIGAIPMCLITQE
jgi:hypothetical protein